MPKLFERLREIVSAQEDAFFETGTLLYYLNKSQDKVVSHLIQTERTINKSLRALDALKDKTDITNIALSDDGNGIYVGSVPLPENLNAFVYLYYKNKTPLIELTLDNLIKIKRGNLKPTQEEGYFAVVDTFFDLFVYTDITPELTIYYVKNPTEITEVDESLIELPKQLENSVLYGAAVMVLLQESVGQQINNVHLYNQLYQSELQIGSY